MKQGHRSGSVRLWWSIRSSGTVHHTAVCGADISSDTSPLCATAIEMEQLQAPGTINYLGREQSGGHTNKGEELSLPSSAIGLRTACRSREGVEGHTRMGSFPAREAEIMFCF